MRTRELPEELDADTRGLIDAARGAHEPSELNRARVRKGVDVKLAAGLALAVPATSAFAGALKLTAAVVAVGTVVGAGVYATRPRPAPAPSPSHARVAKVEARATPAVEPPSEIPAPPPASPPRAPKHRVVVHAPAVAEGTSSLKEETALLGEANAALGRGDVARALSVLRDYDRRPGAPLLAEERAVTGILASCAAGRVDEARAEARRFRARWPRSPLAARVDAACVGAP